MTQPTTRASGILYAGLRHPERLTHTSCARSVVAPALYCAGQSALGLLRLRLQVMPFDQVRTVFTFSAISARSSARSAAASA
jgi:hypothetical protein